VLDGGGHVSKVERRLGEYIEDIAQIISLSSPGEEGRRELEFSILRYISKLRKPCPTPGCNHGLTQAAAVCSGYECKTIIIGRGQSSISLSSLEGGDEANHHHQKKSYPLVIPVFCFVFSELASEGCSDKEICKKCREEYFSYKRKFDGLFCHGCGFFVDYENRTVGYSSEWTTSSELMTRLDIKCSYCETNYVSTKFGDYWFCTPQCMQNWYLSGGKRVMREKEDKEREGRISFLR
jgi:hypothetical protein